MTKNKQTVNSYMDAFARGDHAAVMSCLTEDVEWIIPGLVSIAGKDAFDKEMSNEAFVGKPDIAVSRLTEEGDVVVAEGSVRTQKRDGTRLQLAFCDVFEMQEGRIRRLFSYLMETKLEDDAAS
jgi:ketosteroid isomerase-like protein